jgi:hypothetical protein
MTVQAVGTLWCSKLLEVRDLKRCYAEVILKRHLQVAAKLGIMMSFCAIFLNQKRKELLENIIAVENTWKIQEVTSKKNFNALSLMDTLLIVNTITTDP